MAKATDPMQDNPVRKKLSDGGTAWGTMAFEFFSAGLPQVLGQAGAEFVILDMEHSGVGLDTVKPVILGARGTGCVPMVRVPGTHYHLIAPALDAGAMGIMVPMVETRDQAERIAAWCRYRPEGVRGLAFSIAHDGYGGGDVKRKIRLANRRTLVIALIETATGIENVEEIMAVPGIDVGWLGHFDLTNSLGITAQFDHPKFRAAERRLIRACRQYGKAAGFLASSVGEAKAAVRRGFRCLCFSTDVGLMRNALAEGLAAVNRR